MVLNDAKRLQEEPRRDGRRFIGRRDQLDRVVRAIDQASLGTAQAVLIEGPSGYGKTRIAEETAATARERGFTVARVRSISAGLSSLTSFQIAEELGIEDGHGEGSLALFRLIRSEVERLAAMRKPLALIVDDLDECSPEDLALVRDLVLRAPQGPLLMVLTVSSSNPFVDTTRSALVELRSEPHVHVVTLAPFSREEIEEVVRARPECDAATEPFIRALHELTAGVPFYVDALLDDIAGMPDHERAQLLLGSRALDAVPVPARVRESLAPLVIALDDVEQQIVRALSIWRGAATIEDLVLLTDLDEQQVEAAAERLEYAELLDSHEVDGAVEFTLRDPMLRLVVRGDIRALALNRLHDRAARAIEARPDKLRQSSAVTAAEHFVRARGELTEPRVQTVIVAARWLNETSRYGQARDLLTRLVARLTQERAEDRLPEEAYALLAEASTRLGEWDDAERLLSTAHPAVRDGDARARLMLRAARDHVARGRDADALRLYRTLLDDPALTPAVRLRVAEDAARVNDELGHHEEARSIARQAAEDAERIGEIELASDIWVSYHSHLLYAAEPRASLRIVRHGLRLARRCDSEQARGRAHAGVGNALIDLVGLPRGIRWLRRSLQEAQSSGDSAALSWVAARLAQAYQETGEWEEARAAARLAIHTDVALHRPRSESRARATLSIIESLAGNRAEAALQMSLAKNGPTDELEPLRGVSYTLAVYEHAVTGHDVPRAAEAIHEALRLMTSTPNRRRTLLVELLPRHATVQSALGHADETRQAHVTFKQILGEIPEGASTLIAAQQLLLEGEVAAVGGDARGAADAFGRAAACFAGLGYRWRHALALNRQGEVLIAAGHTDGAADVLGEAFTVLREIEATPLLETVRAMIRDLGHRPPRARRSRSGVLTERERQVLGFAAQGLRDAEIARMLWISPRTVTTHMHNLLTKLGLRSRHELPSWLESNGGAEALSPAGSSRPASSKEHTPTF